MTRLFFDLECIPTQKQEFIDEIAKDITHPGTMKKAETIEKWEEEQKPAAIEAAVSKTVFDGGMGEIITFGWAVVDGPAQTIQRDENMSEYDLLNEVAHVMGGLKMPPVWIGHNICGFDLRYLWKRAIINGCYVGKIPYDAKPWSPNVYDTMFEWAGTGSDKKSLDFVCKALGLKGKDGMDGSMVYQAWKDGKYTEIAEYCADDVEMTRNVYNRLNFIG